MSAIVDESLKEACDALEDRMRSLHQRNRNLYHYVVQLKFRIQHLLEYTIEQIKPLRALAQEWKQLLTSCQNQYTLQLTKTPAGSFWLTKLQQAQTYYTELDEDLLQLERAFGIVKLAEGLETFPLQQVKKHRGAGLYYNLESQLHPKGVAKFAYTAGNSVAIYDYLNKQVEKLMGANQQLRSQFIKHKAEILELHQQDLARLGLLKKAYVNWQNLSDSVSEIKLAEAQANILHSEALLGTFYHSIKRTKTRLAKLRQRESLLERELVVKEEQKKRYQQLMQLKEQGQQLERVGFGPQLKKHLT